MVALYDTTHPAKGDIDAERWQREVTEKLNSIEQAIEFVTGSIALTDDAASLGKWFSQMAKTGNSEVFDYATISEAFPDATPMELLDAVSELELEGYLDVGHAMNAGPFTHVRLNFMLYETFDPIVFEDVNPRADAAIVAQEMLEENSGVSASDLMEKHGWSMRRTNPAMLIIGQYIGDGRKSTPFGTGFAIRSMFAHGEERIILKRFIQSVNMK